MNKWLFSIICLLLISAIASNVYIFYIKKDFDFTVETPCNEMHQTCYLRNCSDGSCPPNNLGAYRVFHMNGADFSACESDSCANTCLSGSTKCVETLCDASEETVCSHPVQVQ